MGSAHFHHYQTFSHVIAAYVSIIFGTTATYLWSGYLLLALWPVAVYLGVRLLGWDKWTAAVAALASPLLMSASGYGFERSSYVWRGYGLWPQLWGMWTLPLAWGLSWQAVRGAGRQAQAALAVALTIAFHFVAGFLALIALGAFSLVSAVDLPRRVLRGAVVAAAALIATVWIIVPLLIDSRWIPTSEFIKGTVFADSYGYRKVLGWLVTGRLFDEGRFPIVSLLVAAGVVVCAIRFRRDARARSLIIIGVISVILFFGPASLGPLPQVVPLLGVLPLHRFVMGVHLTGIVLAGIGGASVATQLVAQGRRFLPEVRTVLQAAVVAALGLLLLSPAWKQVADFDRLGVDMKRAQQLADATDGADVEALVDRMKTLGPGRVYAGGRANWGGQYRVGYVPVYSVLSTLSVDVVGFTLRVTSLMTDPEAYYDERNPAQYDMFDVRYLILPEGQAPAVDATPIATQGRHHLWRVNTSGYFDVVDTVGPPIPADRANLARQTLSFMQSPDLAAKRYRWIAYEGGGTPAPTLAASDTATTPSGSVALEHDFLADGRFTAEVVANRTAVVLLKESYDPRLRASVDGLEVRPAMIAPAYIGVPVGPGRHQVALRYVPYPSYPLLIALGLFALIALAAYPRRATLFSLRTRAA